MAPKHDLSEKDAPPGKKQARKTITLEQKVDIIRKYDTGSLLLPFRTRCICQSTLQMIWKDKEKIMAAFKAGAGSASTSMSSGQSTFMARLEKMLVMSVSQCDLR